MFRIREATVNDAQNIRDLYAPFVKNSAITFHTVVPSAEEFREQMQHSINTYPWYVAETKAGDIVGYANAGQHHERQAYRWSVNVSIYLAPDHQGQGIGRLLYDQLFATLRRQGFRMVHAGITLPNEPSQKIHESMGFQYVGTFPAAGFKQGVWKDVGWWVLDLKPALGHDEKVAEPIPFSRLP